MVERNGLEGRVNPFRGERLVGLSSGRDCHVGVEIGQHDIGGRRDGLANPLELVHAADALRAPHVTINRDDDLGVELPRTINHARRAHFGRYGTKDGAQRCRGDVHGDGFGKVRHIGHHPVAHSHAGTAQARLNTSNFLDQTSCRPFACAPCL